MHERRLTAHEKRFEEYVAKRGGAFEMRRTGDDHHSFDMPIIVFQHVHEGQRFVQETMVGKVELEHDEVWEHLLDTLNGTFSRALQRHIRGVH